MNNDNPVTKETQEIKAHEVIQQNKTKQAQPVRLLLLMTKPCMVHELPYRFVDAWTGGATRRPIEIIRARISQLSELAGVLRRSQPDILYVYGPCSRSGNIIFRDMAGQNAGWCRKVSLLRELQQAGIAQVTLVAFNGPVTAEDRAFADGCQVLLGWEKPLPESLCQRWLQAACRTLANGGSVADAAVLAYAALPERYGVGLRVRTACGMVLSDCYVPGERPKLHLLAPAKLVSCPPAADKKWRCFQINPKKAAKQPA